MEKPTISFDDTGKLRVLDAEKAKQTEELERECRAFVSKIGEFSETVQGVVEGLTAQAQVIETEKLKAIGQRNLVESERDTRRRKQRELQGHIDEKNAELARLNAQHDSLLRIEQEQLELIKKLSENEPGGI